jgi:hypothetical protein
MQRYRENILSPLFSKISVYYSKDSFKKVEDVEPFFDTPRPESTSWKSLRSLI